MDPPRFPGRQSNIWRQPYERNGQRKLHWLRPVVFTMGDDGLAHGGEVPPEMLDIAQEARDGCPTSAISIEE